MKRKPNPKPDGRTPSRDNPMFLDRRAPPGLTFSQFGAAMLVDGLTPHAAIGRILEHLGLSTPQAEKPPPIREVVRVAEYADGWGVPAKWA